MSSVCCLWCAELLEVREYDECN